MARPKSDFWDWVAKPVVTRHKNVLIGRQKVHKPIAVLISDVHYSVQTLELADKAVRMAIDRANDLNVPLIVAGDLHDTKANMRAECVNRMIETFERCKTETECYVLIGNHDKINERSEDHSLKFLEEFVYLVDRPQLITDNQILCIPYQPDKDDATMYLREYGHDAYPIVIMHQGIQGSHSGDYFQDHSALCIEDVAGRRVISGHYHRRQTIQLPDSGVWDYIGNPFTLNYGEANDPEKGFQILMEDGSLEFVPTYLRTHAVVEAKVNIYFERYLEQVSGTNTSELGTEDLVKVKLMGSKDELSQFNKESVKRGLRIPGDFKLELVPNDQVGTTEHLTPGKSQHEQLDEVIDSIANTDKLQKERLKTLWKKLV